MPSAQTYRPIPGSLSSAISDSVVGLLNEYTGRRPTEARTYINEDLITVVLHDTLTKEERDIVRDGGSDLVRVTREAFQKGMKPDLIAAVERLSGRTIIAFMSESHIDPDLAIESFVLAPRAERAFPNSYQREVADTSNALSPFSRGLSNATQWEAHDHVEPRWMVALPFALCFLFIAGLAFFALALLVLAESGIVMAIVTDLVALNLLAVLLGTIFHQRRARQSNRGGRTRMPPARREVPKRHSPNRSHTLISP